MNSVKTTTLDILEVSEKAKTAFYFNEMDTPLLSIPGALGNGKFRQNHIRAQPKGDINKNKGRIYKIEIKKNRIE